MSPGRILKKIPLVGRPLHALTRRILDRRSPGTVFKDIYRKNAWGDSESRSGAGSNLEQTAEVRRVLPILLRELDCQSLLDVPCGDFNWMSRVELDVDYIGGDIVDDLVASNRARHGGPRRRFERLDLLAGGLPRADLVLCRDCLVHLSFRHIRTALASIKASKSTWLVTTTFPSQQTNEDIVTGSWRMLNLQAQPFSLPPPIRLINERCPVPGRSDKSLGVWRIDSLELGDESGAPRP